MQCGVAKPSDFSMTADFQAEHTKFGELEERLEIGYAIQEAKRAGSKRRPEIRAFRGMKRLY